MALRLESPGARVYTPILPQQGHYESRVLKLEVEVERERIRVLAGTALLLESEELVARLEGMVDDLQRRLAEEATQRREIEDELACLREELSRLKR